MCNIFNAMEKTKTISTQKIVWRAVLFICYLHISSIYGLWLALTSAKLNTIIFSIILWYMAIIGITAGAHRLWSHNSYKVNRPLEFILLLCNTLSAEYSVIRWVRYHRAHHKYTDTDADPYNAARGLFYSHIGWLMLSYPPKLIEKFKEISTIDLEQRSMVKFQFEYYFPLILLFSYILPTVTPVVGWNESWIISFHVATVLRYTCSLNCTFSINSFAHKYGNRPYDRTMSSTESLSVGILAFGEGWHNYHHTFPSDYKSGEFGHSYLTNFTKLFIDFFAVIGWAYDLKFISNVMIERRITRTGDGTHSSCNKNIEHNYTSEHNEIKVLNK